MLHYQKLTLQHIALTNSTQQVLNSKSQHYTNKECFTLIITYAHKVLMNKIIIASHGISIKIPSHGDDVYNTQNVGLVEFYRFCLKHVLSLMNTAKHFKINLAPNYTHNFTQTHILLFPVFIPTVIKNNTHG